MTTTQETIIEPTQVKIPTNWAPRFFTIWIGEALSLLGSVLVQFALIWWFATTTGSATALAFSSIVGLVPQVLIGPFAGVLVDRWNRRRVMIVADTLIALSTVALIVLFATGVVELWHVYLILFIRAVCSTFYSPAMQASTALMVPESQLTRIAGINQTVNAVINIASPTLGALLVSALPMTSVLSIDVITALLAVVPLLFINIPQPKRQEVAAPAAQPGKPHRRTRYKARRKPRTQSPAMQELASIWHDLADGFHYVTLRRGLFLFCLLAAALNFLSAPLSSLLALLVTEHLGGEAIELGSLTSIFGVGMLVGAVALSVWGGFKRKIYTTLVAITGSGVGVLLLGASSSFGFGMALAGVAVMGFLMPLSNGPIDAILQSTVDPEKQARVFTLMGSLAGIAMPLGLAVAGPLADAVSLPVVFTAIGVLYILVGASGFLVPSIVNLEGQKTKESPAAAG